MPSIVVGGLAVQNLLAQAASLLYRVGETLGEDPCLPHQTLLKIEIATFFSEGKKSLSEVVLKQGTRMSKELGPSAPSAESFGEELNLDPREELTGSTSFHAGPASNTETPISPEAPSGNFSSGGTEGFPQLLNSLDLSSPKNFSIEKFDSAPSKSSARFLSIPNSNGRRMLVALDDISNIVESEDPSKVLIYYKSQLEPDLMLIDFSTLERMLYA